MLITETNMNLRLPKALHEKFKAKCASDKISMSERVRALLEEETKGMRKPRKTTKRSK